VSMILSSASGSLGLVFRRVSLAEVPPVGGVSGGVRRQGRV
jgi:hypothetical protein